MKRALATLFLVLFVTVSNVFASREVHNLNSDWRIYPASKSSGDDAYTISLPHCWGQDPITPSTLTNANYLRTIYAPEMWRIKRVFLKFYGVQSVADLFVNGLFVGEHRGGSTAFTFEITDFLRYNEDNTIMLKVSSAAQNDVLPTSFEHAIYGGIYRDVELIVTPQVAISPVFYSSDGIFVRTNSIKNGRVVGEVEVKTLADNQELCDVDLRIKSRNGEIFYENKFMRLKVSGEVPLLLPFQSDSLKLWSPNEPNLYKLEVLLRPTGADESDMRCDRKEVLTGFRLIEKAEQGAENMAIRINGEPHLLRGVSLYHDHPIEGSVMTPEIYRADMSIIRDMGANAIRSAITPHDRALYSLCDKEGVIAWVDTPFARSTFFSDIAYFPTQRFVANGLEQLQEIIYQNYNHPSVAMWGIFSLLSPRGDSSLEYVERLNTLAKEIDKTRPTVALSSQNGKFNEVTDLIVWLQNLGWDKGALSDIELWQNLIHRRWGYLSSAVMFGEKGVVYHQIERKQIPMCRVEKRRGWHPEARQSEMHEEYMKYLCADSLFWGLWSPAMFDYRSPRSDIGESATGLVNFDRTIKKDAFYLYRALWNKSDATLHIADKRSRLITDDLLTLRVYASDSTPPVAYIDGQSYDMRSVAPAQFQLDSIPLQGRVKVVVKQGELADSVEFIKGSPLKALEY